MEYFETQGIDPLFSPGVLLPFHGPFTWGKDCMDAVKNAIILEEVARMAFKTRTIAGGNSLAPGYLLEKHFKRKHGPGAYYGQK